MEVANMKKIIDLISLFKIHYSLFIILYSLFFILPSSSYALSLESYCKDGYYQIPGEDQCSRAPNCGGRGYDDVAALPQPNPQACMGDGAAREQNGCAGYVPVCCYEVQRTHDPTMCVGYWERLWCTPSQCANLDPEKAAICGGGNCQCAHAFKSYCGDKPPISLETRLGMQVQPTTPPTQALRPTSIPLTSVPPTTVPTPTKVIIPTYSSTQPTNPSIRPPFINPTQVPQKYTNYPTSTPFLHPTNTELPISIGVGIFQASIKDAITSMKISITKTVIASKKALDLPSYAGEKILSLDQQLEMFMNGMIEQIRRNITGTISI